MIQPHRYLRLHDLRSLRHYLFSSRRAVEGQYGGRHASSQRGHSVEFNDYREYVPGDEIADVDWRVYGRSDKMFIKLFEHQSDVTVNLLVDASASMGYAGLDAAPEPGDRAARGPASWWKRVGVARDKFVGGRDRAVFDAPSKFDQACLIAAAIAFLTTKQQDRVAFGVAQDGLKQFQRPLRSFTHLRAVLGAMEAVSPGGKARLAEALRSFAMRTSRKGLLVLLSDLLDDPDEVLAALAAFTHRGNEVIVFQVLHADELSLPVLAEAMFIDSESDEHLRVNVHDVRHTYQKRLERFLGSWSGALRVRGMDHNLVSTAVHYNKALERYLFSRASRV